MLWACSGLFLSSAPCISNIQGFTMVILILQALSPLRPPAALTAPQAAGEARGLPTKGLHQRSHCPCRRINFGNYWCKGSRAAVMEGEMLEAIALRRLPLSGMTWGKQPYHGLAAFAGDWAPGQVEENRGHAGLPTSQLINVQRGFYNSLEVTESKPLPSVDGTLPV